MKKLMIAAAAAAMIGGAFADTVYTFTASVKTTKAKDGKSTATYYLGTDGSTMWYADASLASYKDANGNFTNTTYFTTKKVGGQTVPALTSAAKKNYAWLKATIVPLAATYNQKSGNKWCETIKVTDEGCYRVAGSKKVTDLVYGDICCEALTGYQTEKYDGDYDVDASSGLTQFFGGLTYDKATKAEIFAEVTGVGITTAYIAGQGKVGKIIDNDNGTLSTTNGISSISGNIVGVIEGPECEYCCTVPPTIDAVAFECGNTKADGTLDTAAYGTWSLKYNAKETKELY